MNYERVPAFKNSITAYINQIFNSYINVQFTEHETSIRIEIIIVRFFIRIKITLYKHTSFTLLKS